MHIFTNIERFNEVSHAVPSDQRLRRIARWCGAVITGLGCLVILGWVMGWEPVKRLLPGLVAMKANTAVLFLLTGSGLLLVGGAGKRRFLYAGGLGLAIAAFSSLLLFDILVGVPWDLQGWMAPAESGPLVPILDHPSPSTALSFLTLGVAFSLLASSRPGSVRIARGLTLFPAGAGLVTLVGYLYSIQGLYQPAPNTTAMALHTGLGLLVASIGLFAAHPQAGIVDLLVSPTAGARMFRFLFPYAALTLVLLGWFRLVAERAGIIQPGHGTAAFVLGAIFVLGILLWHHARDVNEAELRDEEAQRQRQEFVAMLAHELRNPLAAITNGAAVLEHSELDERGRRTREMIGRQSRHMARLVDGLLDLSRLTRGRIELHRQEVQLDTLLSRILEEDARTAIEQREQKVTKEIQAPLLVEGDPVRLAQVFSNLISNASRFAPSGSRIRVAARANGAKDVVVSVTDEGPGISAEDRERIFEPFFQTEQTLARSDGGLGIGLTLTRQIVDLHGGTVAVESDGDGSTFTVVLPRRHRRIGIDSGVWG